MTLDNHQQSDWTMAKLRHPRHNCTLRFPLFLYIFLDICRLCKLVLVVVALHHSVTLKVPGAKKQNKSPHTDSNDGPRDGCGFTAISRSAAELYGLVSQLGKLGVLLSDKL